MKQFGRHGWAILFIGTLWACQPPAAPSEDPAPVVDSSEIALPDLPAPALPPPPPDYDTSQWEEVIRLDTTILIDLRYATTDNFVETQLYECARCFLRPEVAGAVVDAHRQLRRRGLGLKMYDCYRPASVQWKLWGKVPDRRYVADPRKGSMHSRGNGVDLTLVDSTGQELPMGTAYDFFGPEAHSTYEDLPEEILTNRQLLSEVMRSKGFRAIRTEWWHFSFPGKPHALADMVWNCPPPASN